MEYNNYLLEVNSDDRGTEFFTITAPDTSTADIIAHRLITRLRFEPCYHDIQYYGMSQL